jgi:DNA-damage-inducible protein J
MNKTDNLTIRVEPKLKKNVEEKLNDMGITMAQAITMYFRQIDMTDSIPFVVKRHKYNAETIQAMKNAREGKNLTGPFDTVDEMWTYLEKELEKDDEE